MFYFIIPEEYPKWFIFTPIANKWAKANQSMVQSIMLMMDMQPHLYEGWKVCRMDDPSVDYGD